MEVKQYKNILALSQDGNEFYAFHAHNLDVAEISPEMWASMNTSGMPVEVKEWSESINEDTQDAPVLSHINTLSINVAQICNLKCDYCAAGGDGTYGSKTIKLDLSKIEKQLVWIASKLPKGETLSVRFLGGEPLLYPKAIAHIAEFIKDYVADKELKLEFNITTNGTLINIKTAMLLADLNCGVTVSLDGPKDINDQLRPSKNNSSSTEMTLAGLNQLKRVRHQLRHLKINSVFGSHNQDVLKTYKFLKTLNVDIDIYNFNFANNAEDTDSTHTYLAEMKALAKLIMQTEGLSELAKITQFRNVLARLEAQTRSHSYCGAGKSLLQIDTEHKLYTCNWFMGDEEELVGENTDLDLQKWERHSDSLIQLNNCNSCWARHLCGGGCMAVHKQASGSKHDKDPMFCLRSRTLAAEAIYYFTQSLLKERVIKGDQDETH